MGAPKLMTKNVGRPVYTLGLKLWWIQPTSHNVVLANILIKSPANSGDTRIAIAIGRRGCRKTLRRDVIEGTGKSSALTFYAARRGTVIYFDLGVVFAIL